MIGDFMTKPLQGALLRKFRDQTMGVIPNQDPGPGKSHPGKAQPGKAQPGNVKPKKGNSSGGGFSLGHGFPIVSSTKQKLNTRSSTETKLVGADDFIPDIYCTRYVLKAQ